MKKIAKTTKKNAATKTVLAGMTAFAIMAGSVGVKAETLPDPGGLDLSNLNTLMAQIVWQDRMELMTSQERLSATSMYGRENGRENYDTAVSRSNLLNSPAARYLVGKVSD